MIMDPKICRHLITALLFDTPSPANAREYPSKR